MGWYVTCATCGLQEKYHHPDCGCPEKGMGKIVEKVD